MTKNPSQVDKIKGKAEEQKRRHEEALVQTTGIRTLPAIVAAGPVRLMKRDLLFVVERLAALLDERRLEIVARQRGIKQVKDSNSRESVGRLFAAHIRRAEGSDLALYARTDEPLFRATEAGHQGRSPCERRLSCVVARRLVRSSP